jgi:hypothetical protein
LVAAARAPHEIWWLTLGMQQSFNSKAADVTANSVIVREISMDPDCD